MKTTSRRGHVHVRVATAVAFLLLTRAAAAEVSVIKADGWELFTDGRVGGFVSYARGDGFPVVTPPVLDPSTMMPIVPGQNPFGGGIGNNDQFPIADPSMPLVQPTIENMRLRSGFLGNLFAFGVRRNLTPWTTLTGYMQFWSTIETQSSRKYLPMPVDVRQGFLKAEGLWGSFAFGRMLTLFSRGSAEIDFLYGHGYGLGFPGNLNSSGPTAGHVGTGVMGPGFAAGFIYATPSLAGLQLNIGIFDPVVLQGAWDRTKWARPEVELTYDRQLGGRSRIHLFSNGVYQKVYRLAEPDSVNTTVYGVGYGGRIELGPFHVGVAGHYGRGLGLYYALETTDAAYNEARPAVLRKSDGYYLQTQLALTKFDINAGAGISRIYELPTDGVPDLTSFEAKTVIKYQLGLSGVLVYHYSSTLHMTLEYFRATYRWFAVNPLTPGGQIPTPAKQDVNFVNAGMMLTW